MEVHSKLWERMGKAAGMGARRRRRFALGAAILTIVLLATVTLAPGASGRRGISVARAEPAARNAVLAHPSYRKIASTRSGLVTRGCWGVAGGAVRCSLYVVAPNPCALNDDTESVCAQALWQRRWLVEVRRGRDGPAARILKIASGPSGA